MAEGLADKLSVSGASAEDLEDSIVFLSTLKPDPHAGLQSSLAALPWLEARFRNLSRIA
jgi:hypothetical protein